MSGFDPSLPYDVRRSEREAAAEAAAERAERLDRLSYDRSKINYRPMGRSPYWWKATPYGPELKYPAAEVGKQVLITQAGHPAKGKAGTVSRFVDAPDCPILPAFCPHFARFFDAKRSKK